MPVVVSSTTVPYCAVMRGYQTGSFLFITETALCVGVMSVADTGFPVGGEGGADLGHGRKCMRERKNWVPLGGAGGAP